jgi:2-oxoglutarate ferredoxin oxidoreductase subunit beta
MHMAVTYKPAAPIWCSGCGHFGVEAALKQSLRNLSIEPHEAIVLAGIGCSGTIQNYMGCYGYHALHGRVLPTATGVALANPGLTVIAAGGDGDGYAIGCGHLVHTFRRNPSLLYVVMNNGTYGLTKGQPSPTAVDRADQEHVVDAVHLGLTIPGSTFLARGFVGHMSELVSLFDAGLTHVREKRGFAFLEVISPCVTFNDNYPSWRELLVNLDGDESYDCGDRTAASANYARLIAAGRLPSGLIYLGSATTFEAASGITAENSPACQDLSVSSHIDRYRNHMDQYAV